MSIETQQPAPNEIEEIARNWLASGEAHRQDDERVMFLDEAGNSLEYEIYDTVFANDPVPMPNDGLTREDRVRTPMVFLKPVSGGETVKYDGTDEEMIVTMPATEFLTGVRRFIDADENISEVDPEEQGAQEVASEDDETADDSDAFANVPDEVKDRLVAIAENVFEATDKVFVADAIAKLGLPEGSERDVVNRAIEDRITELHSLAHGLNEFEPIRQKAIREINETMQMQQNRLTGLSLDGLAAYIEQDFGKLQRFHELTTRGSMKPLSPNTGKVLDQLTRSIRTFRGAYEGMVSGGRTFIDTEMASEVKRTLQQIPEITRAINQEVNEAEQMLANVSGYANVQELYRDRAEQEKAEFRNNQVRGWAEELKSPELSEERRKEIEEEMLTAVERESAMTDDPNSPRVWFDRGIVRNGGKSRREGSKYSGRVDADIGSQQHVAEIMSDMLSGKFNIEAANTLSPIYLYDKGSPDEKVAFGRHRAAALAMLYGNDWVKVARSKGIEVNDKVS